MSHYAEIVNGLVTSVIVAEQDFIDTLPGKWVQTSYNTRGGIHFGPDGEPDGGVALRGNYARLGMAYDEVLDEFIEPKPYPSWVIGKYGYWQAPKPMPANPPAPGSLTVLVWDEAALDWVEKPLFSTRSS